MSIIIYLSIHPSIYLSFEPKILKRPNAAYCTNFYTPGIRPASPNQIEIRRQINFRTLRLMPSFIVKYYLFHLTWDISMHWQKYALLAKAEQESTTVYYIVVTKP